MARDKTCPKCQSAMEEGFVLDQGADGRRHVGTWVPGAPEKSFWSGLSLKNRTPIEIATWRCRSCGFLENYAG
jgi:hypothetical protein